MAPSEYGNGLEEQMGQWRNYLRHRQSIANVDIEELEDHLRNQILALVGTGLTSDEAFLVAVKRMGDMDTLTREFAREHSARLWEQLVAPSGASDGDPDKEARSEFVVVVGLAMIAALAVKLPELFGGPTIDDNFGFYARNFSLFILPLLTGYFAWKRKLDSVTRRWLLVPFALAIIFANVFPFTPGGSTLLLTALHLPIALWLAVGIAYAGGRWSSSGGRMDFIRFSGELFIYYVLIAFGGFVLILFTFSMFAAIGLNVEWLVGSWLVPCGALGAVIIGAWLVEAKQSVVENMAPVLTRLFTPLFAVVLLAFLATMGVTGRGIDLDRDALIGFDLILALVLGLLLYSISARDPLAKPDIFDALQVVLVISALIVDALALAAIAARISEFGFSPNRVAALGENIILLVNLAWSAQLYARFLAGRQGVFVALERWQTAYLPVYAIWAAFVVIVFPPLFGYV